ncbi:MAG: RNA 2',3'-cyclic phosphodiesterase [Gemmatimonadaceae bacterium]|nr:RNA 2',3'-cyclic phosphodiesterase [Gemmatimonadaceae bacterium]
MRLFLALDLDDDVRAAVDHAREPLRALEPSLAWVPSERLHLTLRFFGDVEPPVADALVVAVGDVARQHRPFGMVIEGLGAFPNFRRARVVWCGVEHDPRLELLHHDVELAGERCGMEVEGRPFRPHVTVGRVRAPIEEARGRALRRAARGVKLHQTQAVARITLYESTLAPDGARYRRVHAASLGGD